MNSIAFYIPIKENSNRIPNKNFKLFNNKPLFTFIIDKLIKIKLNSSLNLNTSIYINTDSQKILNFYIKNDSIILLKRKKRLRGDNISMNLLIKNDLKFIKEEHIFQTHVTNPLLKIETIINAINKYFYFINTKKKYDNILSVNEVKKRFYDKNFKPINHDLKKLINTQDLEPLYEENSNFYIFSKKSFLKNNFNRIGRKPYFYIMNQIEAIDIDNLEEFYIAEKLYQYYENL